MGKNVKNGSQLAVAVNRRWQSTGGGSQPAVAINRQPAVTVETVLPSATLQCVAVSNDSDRRKHKIQQVTEDE